MERTDVNPWEWSKAFGFSQAVSVAAPERVLLCSGQTAVDADGGPPPADADMATQITAAVANLKTVLEAAGMSLGDIVKATIYTTDVDGYIAASGAMAEPMAGNLPGMTLIGVARLGVPRAVARDRRDRGEVALELAAHDRRQSVCGCQMTVSCQL